MTGTTFAPAIPLPALSRVAVVGAGGPSGLAAVRQLLDAGVRPDQIGAFELRASAGGVWNYDAVPGEMKVEWRKDGPPVVRSQKEVDFPGTNGPSAIYDRLRTNLPNSIMMYRGCPFSKDTPIFPTHQQVLSYLQSHAEAEGLVDVIQWSTRVLAVYHTPDSTLSAQRWTVETEHTAPTGQRTRQTGFYSHVIISNGHYNEPYLPPIPGLAASGIRLVHARWWRNPVEMRGKNIVVVGSRASGSDIARELAMDDYERAAAGEEVKRTVYQSVRGYKDGDLVWDDEFPWAKQIHCFAEIASADGKTLTLVDGTQVENIDTIVFATGYLYSYPFFPDNAAPFDKFPVTSPLSAAQNDLPRAGGQNISNLNNTDTFYVPDPTLAFIGLHYAVNPFPLGEATARLIARSFVNGAVPPLPPLKRSSDDPTDIKIGCPAEFDNQDAWLLAIGEGVEDGGPNGGWPQITAAVRDARANALKARKAVLGY